MRRILALFLCIFLFATPVYAANAAASIETTAIVTANSACEVTVDVEIRLDEPVRGLKFPLGREIRSATLNGTEAHLTQTNGVTSVDLSHLDGRTGLYTCTIRYQLNSVVTTDDGGKQTVTVPLLSGFPYPVEKMSFTVTLPSTFATVPTFYSGYHGQDIERQMSASIDGAVITGTLVQELKDSETLYMNLTAPEGMFPASQNFGGSLTFDAAAMGICAAAALVWWVLFLFCLPRRVPRRSTVPEGICAGQMGSYLLHKTTDLPLMVLQWAQLGYMTIRLDRGGRVYLSKKMDMGNERSYFEQRCFRELFGRKDTMEGTGERFQRTWDRTNAMSRKASNGYRFPPAVPALLLRLLSCMTGLFAGIAMGDTVSTNHTWRIFIMAALGILCAVLCWFIQDGMAWLHLRRRAPLKLTAAAFALLLLAGFLCRCGGYALGAAAFNLLSGLMAFYGGRHSDNGTRLCTEILGLRRHLKKERPDELRRILTANRNYYFELAPYALAFGLDKSFADKFGVARLPSCTWLISGREYRTAPEWYPLLRAAYQAMHRGRRPTLAERLFGK